MPSFSLHYRLGRSQNVLRVLIDRVATDQSTTVYRNLFVCKNNFYVCKVLEKNINSLRSGIV